ncbi:hypothetical protein [uncultured Roseibium sp.]|uniref:hypothetical protein n=1 Tax=uncultured Roseibium sp. TaxID=1936171 RepID=UPI00260B27E3|nr:hypothetical protein [uncultured Roseibium sp.]
MNICGDGRLTIEGAESCIDLRTHVDISGRPGTDHVFPVDGKHMKYFDAKGEGERFFVAFRKDIAEHTETAMMQAHAFLAAEPALNAQPLAEGGKTE